MQVDGEIFSTEIRDTFNVSSVLVSDMEGEMYKQRVNAGGSTVQGFEINANYKLSERLSTEIGASYVDARFDEAPEVLPGLYENRYLETPEWTGVAQLNYKNDDLVDLFLGVVYTGPMIAARSIDGTLNESTQSFWVVDLTATKHVHLTVKGKELHIDLMAGVKNVFDERQPDLTSGPGRDTTYFYGPRFPRSFVCRAGVDW